MRSERQVTDFFNHRIDTTPFRPETWEDWVEAFTKRFEYPNLLDELSYKITMVRRKARLTVQFVHEYALEVCGLFTRLLQETQRFAPMEEPPCTFAWESLKTAYLKTDYSSYTSVRTK